VGTRWERGGNESRPLMAPCVPSCHLEKSLCAGNSAWRAGCPVARASLYGTEGHRFESCRAPSLMARNAARAPVFRPIQAGRPLPSSPLAPPIPRVIAARLQRKSSNVGGARSRRKRHPCLQAAERGRRRPPALDGMARFDTPRRDERVADTPHGPGGGPRNFGMIGGHTGRSWTLARVEHRCYVAKGSSAHSLVRRSPLRGA
jgi:hypothetical protein